MVKISGGERGLGRGGEVRVWGWGKERMFFLGEGEGLEEWEERKGGKLDNDSSGGNVLWDMVSGWCKNVWGRGKKGLEGILESWQFNEEGKGEEGWGGMGSVESEGKGEDVVENGKVGKMVGFGKELRVRVRLDVMMDMEIRKDRGVFGEG